MRRVLTTLMILLVVLVAGLSALVLLVNPNDFRAYMVRQVEARSGYQLKLDGPLRWHVWPQLRPRSRNKKTWTLAVTQRNHRSGVATSG